MQFDSPFSAVFKSKSPSLRSKKSINGNIKVDQVEVTSSSSSSSSSSGGARSPALYDYDDEEELSSQAHITVLKETTEVVMVQCRKEFTSKADDILMGTSTYHAFLDFIAAERLRSMPHQGSKWDKVLKWAESYGKQVDLYSRCTYKFTAYTWESARLVWGSCRALLQLGHKHIDFLEKVFSILHQFSLSLSSFLKNKHFFSASDEIQIILSRAYADLVRFTVNVTVHYKKSTRIILADFDQHFGSIIDAFFEHKQCFTSEVWKHTLSQTVAEMSVSIHTIRQWLSCNDRTLEIFLSDRLGTRTYRYEYTCEWFESHLTRFQQSSDNVLWVQGQAGCGKSVLAGWILEKLRRTQGRHGCTVASFTIDGNLKSQRSSISVVKGLLLQLLEASVGNLSLYKSLCGLYERTERGGVNSDVELALWNAFDSAVAKTPGKLMIVVDGLDQLKGGETAVLSLLERLRASAHRYRDVKCIILSRQLPKKHQLASDVCQFTIEHKHVNHDIRRYVEVIIEKTTEFKALKVEERKTIVERITTSCSGKFVWAKFALEILKHEKTVAGILKCLDGLEKAKSLEDLLRQLCRQLDFKKPDTMLLISFLLAASRPLTVVELKSLFEIDVHTCTRNPRLTDIEIDIQAACGSLVTTRDGLIVFSHASIKEYLLELCNSDDSFSLTIKDAHRTISIRSLAYIKLCTKDIDVKPRMDCEYKPSQLTEKHRFFEYAARYWITHFKSSSLYDSSGNHHCTEELKRCFPESSALALIEATWWEKQTSATKALNMHLLALDIRKRTFGASHQAVIQCYFNIGKSRRCQSLYVEASDCYFKAWELVKKVFSETHEISIACAKQYLEITKHESVTIMRKTEVTTRTEVITKYMYTTHKHIHGECHETTIKYGKVLAELFVSLKKTEEALTIFRSVQKACVEVYGETHEETMTVTTTLTTVLEKTSKHEESVTITRSVLEVCERTLQVWEEKRITATIRMCEIYEKRGEIKQAEEVLIKLHTGIVDVCKHRHDDCVHEAKIEITLQYVRFLKRHSRDKEAEKMLIELWGEFKDKLHDKDCEHGQGLLIRIRVIGEEMKKWKIVAVAESVFSTLWGFYKKSSKQTTSEATSVAVLLSGILRVREETHSEEVILKEIFEASITKSTIDVTVIRTCLELSSFYEREERWGEAIHVCHNALVKMWTSFIGFMDTSSTGTCSLPHLHYEEAIQIARRLSICYYKEGRIQEAESVYIYILSACRASLKLQDELIITACEWLVEFYTSTSSIDRAIQCYHDLYEAYRGVLGGSHKLSIKIMYKLAGYCKHHRPRKAEEYYLSIIESHSHTSTTIEICTHETIEATLTICKIYEHDKKYKEALTYYRKLWLTICKLGGECNMSIDIILKVHFKYIQLLERESEFKVIYDALVQFREACIKHFGKHSRITVEVTISLAKILEREESRHKEAIDIYEEVCRIVSEHSELVVVLETTVVQVRKRLAHLYSVHAQLVSKAEVIYFSSYEEHKRKYGCSHEESLSSLYELIIFFKQQKKQECIHTATVTLQTTIVEIITRERDTQRLYNSALAIAKLYIEIGRTELASDLLKEIRKQLISTEHIHSERFGFCLRKGHTLDRRSFVFVTAFEATLKGTITSTSYTVIIQNLMTETTLCESWMRCLRYRGGFEASLKVGARLRLFFHTHSRHEECEKITDELFDLFLAEVGESASKSGIIWQLFLACVEEFSSDESGEKELNILEAGATAVISAYDRGDFAGAYELACWIHKYTHSHGGFDHTTITVGFRLALCLTGHGRKPCTDAKLKSSMLELSKRILTETLHATQSCDIDFVTSLSLKELNLIVSLLGDQKSFSDLERILRALWEARQSQPKWSTDTIVSIGLRLCEVMFAHGHKKDAIHLCTDICYNLRRSWGSLDPSTVRAFNLLSAFYTARNEFGQSMHIHEQVIRAIMSPEADHELEHEAFDVIVQQFLWMRRAHQRLGKWEGSEHECKRLWEDVEELFGRDQLRKGVEPIAKWTKSKSPVEDHVGCWRQPVRWDFLPSDGGRHACHTVNGNDDGMIKKKKNGGRVVSSGFGGSVGGKGQPLKPQIFYQQTSPGDEL